MNGFGLERLEAFLKNSTLQAVLLADVHTLAWLTGCAPPIQTGPNPFEGGPALGWFQDGHLTVIASDGDAPGFRQVGAAVREYPGFTLDVPLDPVTRQIEVLLALLQEARPSSVGAELNHMTAAVFQAVKRQFPDIELQPADSDIRHLRMVKSKDEIEKIRTACALCDLAQRTVAEQADVGQSEIALWAAVKGRIEIEAGHRLPAYPEFVAGVRAGQVGDLPGAYVLKTGDCLRFDLVTRCAGYWGDNCATYFIGEPDPALRKAYGVVLEALARGIESVKAGIPANSLDDLMQGCIEKAGYPRYPHHSGHGVGTAYHEEPRIVPDNPTLLEAGMVIALEPAVYLPGIGGVRLEHTMVVTQDGADLLTRHLPL